MPVPSCTAWSTSVHQTSVTGIIDFTAQLIRQLNRSVESVSFKCCTQTTVDSRHHIISSHFIIFSCWIFRGFNCIAIIILCPVQGFSGFFIHACVIYQIHTIHRFSLFIDTVTINQFSVQVRMQFINLILNECCVQVHTPIKFLIGHDLIIQINFNTRVCHRTNIHRNCCISQATGCRSIVKHIFWFAAKIFNTTIQLIVEQTKIGTDIVWSRSFPSNIRVTFI